MWFGVSVMGYAVLLFVMKLFMYFAELFVGDVRVDLRGGNACVAKHGLDAANVRAVAK